MWIRRSTPCGQSSPSADRARPLIRPAAFFRDLALGTLDLVLAPRCAACRVGIPSAAVQRGICSACWVRARPIPRPRCERCSSIFRVVGAGDTTTCPLCEQLRPAVRSILSAFVLEGPVREMVHALKYNGWHGIGVSMARTMATELSAAALVDPPDLIVPVPLSPARLRQRGYNQAAVLSRGIALSTGIEHRPDTLKKRAGSRTQTTLHPGERRANVARAFWVDPKRAEPIGGNHVLLVDDVWTTGATALACADALLEVGARAVSVLTFARALPELERHTRRLELLDLP